MVKSKNTKERIMKTAINLIWSESYGAVSVEDICKKAAVNKGSFYHYFPSKADLAVAAFAFHFEEYQPKFDRIFSTQSPGLKRLTDYFDLIYEVQADQFEKLGFVCGCPYSSLGTEQGIIEQKIREAMEAKCGAIKKYFAAALRDAQAEDQIEITNIDAKIDEIYCYYHGVLSQARITNNLESIKNIKNGVFDILGIKTEANVS